MKHLLYFYGKECSDCILMEPKITRLEFETGKILTHLEVWHNKENDALCRKYDKNDDCGGVPFFINTKTKQTLCGEVSYNTLKLWATNE